jgi:HAD superfamily hydrolase (TIGR01484 family)
MRFAALATDYDGTLADQGIVQQDTIEALRRFRASGRRLILVTGRTMSSLLDVFPNVEEFDLIVAENGATLFNPSTKSEKVLTEAVEETFLDALRIRGVVPLEVGHVIVATDDSRKQIVLDAIQELGLELHIIFNKGSLMVLPAGVNKASGLEAAASELRLSLHNIAGIGDAENDHALLAACEFSAAVRNALPALKQRVTVVTRGESGCGVVELIEEIVKDDLSSRQAWLGRPILIGRDDAGLDVSVPACSVSLVAGPRLTGAFMEGLATAGYQFCALDPEGDGQLCNRALVLGEARHVPAIPEVLKALEQPSQSVVLNLAGLALESRSGFFEELLRKLCGLRTKTGRPHCLVVDQAHDFLCGADSERVPYLVHLTGGLVLSTPKPYLLRKEILQRVQTLITFGETFSDQLDVLGSGTGLQVSPTYREVWCGPGGRLRVRVQGMTAPD